MKGGGVFIQTTWEGDVLSLCEGEVVSLFRLHEREMC